MCRVLAYLGDPVSLADLLYGPDNCLLEQTHNPRLLRLMNLAGFGMAAWDPRSAAPDEPFLYRTTEFAIYDGNLENLAAKLRPSCLLAHVRGIPLAPGGVVNRQNVHPFRFGGSPVALVHNGQLHRFADMSRLLREHVDERVAKAVVGTTDTAWIHAVLLSQLPALDREPELGELRDAMLRTLGIIREIRDRLGIGVASPVNLFATTGRYLVATRFVLDYGCWGDQIDPDHLTYHSAWYTTGEAFGRTDGEWAMRGTARRSIIVSSEPLTANTSSWIEIPEYTLMTVARAGDELEIDAVEIDV